MILAINKYKVDSFISKHLSYHLEIFCIYLNLNISGYCTFSSNNLCWDFFYLKLINFLKIYVGKLGYEGKTSKIT